MSDPAAFYDAAYRQEDPQRAAYLGRWRALGARSKAAHVLVLCRRAGLEPREIVEIGCGDGALLEALSRAAPAATFDGFELAEPAAAIARDRGIERVRRLEAFDGRHVPAPDGAYELAILSHVLEHVPEPAPLLAEAARVARHVLVEVPLEDNRSARRPGKVAEARAIGHLHAFSRADVHALARDAGLRVLAELTDPLPLRHHAFFASRPAQRAAATGKWALRSALWRAAPRRAERLFTVHHAVLLSR